MKKNVKFNNVVRVSFVDTNREYMECNIKEMIWWNKDDYDNFYISNMRKLKLWIQKHPKTRLKTNDILDIFDQYDIQREGHIDDDSDSDINSYTWKTVNG